MADYRPIKIISDSPEKDNVSFGFDAYAKTIAELIANRENRTPIVVGIYGSWGTGKTTLMESVKNFLDGNAYRDKKIYRKCKTVWFQAWKYNKEEEILAALIEQIFKTMAADNFFNAAKGEIEKLTKSLNKSKIIGGIIEKLTTVDISEFFSELEYKEKLGFYDTFQKFFDDIVWTYLNWRAKLKVSEEPDDKKGALVIFIDDLDRCPESRIVRVLETIKLFMDRPGCVFVVGAAIDIIENALRGAYGDDAGKFMDKIVHVTFNLPQISEKEFNTYLESSESQLVNDIVSHLPVLLPAIKNNPRQLKHFQNNISLMEGIIRNRGIEIDTSSVLHCGIFEYVYPTFWRDLKETPQIITLLKKHIASIETDLDTTYRWDISEEVLKDVPKSLHGYIRNGELVTIIKHFSGTEEDIRILTTLSGIIEVHTELSKPELEKEGVVSFEDMAKVSAGDFLYGDNKKKETIENEFWIDIYPVTNSRYKEFINSGGYDTEKYWAPTGWEWKKENNIHEPKYWADKKWNQTDFPVVGVTWYEAEAFCRWLTLSRDDGYVYRLPMEKEWERAARGKGGLVYPWGDDFDKEKCNSGESGIGQTSRVTRYPNGVSPEGCYDMAGNVWEWTSSFYDDNKNKYVLRGGSWINRASDCRCADRDGNIPSGRGDDVGFRCARTVTL